MPSDFRRLTFRFALGALFLAVCPSVSFAEALLNTFFGLPPGLANAVVRVGAFKANGETLGRGTGTIIGITPDGTGLGSFYCVLTADHVARGAARLGIGFGSSTPGVTQFPFINKNLAGRLRLGAPADLAVFAVDIPNNASVPQVLIPPIIGANAAKGNQIIQVGYGDLATVGEVLNGNPPSGQIGYNETAGSYGTYEAATNTITKLTNETKGIYNFKAVEGTFQLTFNSKGVATQGTSYIFAGDSGGPTFESNGLGGLGLVGVHSISQVFPNDPVFNVPGGFAVPGFTWDDVNANDYAKFIKVSCAAVAAPVPETSSLFAFLIGASTLAAVYFRKHGQES